MALSGQPEAPGQPHQEEVEAVASCPQREEPFHECPGMLANSTGLVTEVKRDPY